MKYILIIGDGMADNPVPTLDNKTPLQHAAIPVMDGLAAKGEVGNVVNCPAGLPAGSDTAILSIFGGRPQCLLHRPLPPWRLPPQASSSSPETFPIGATWSPMRTATSPLRKSVSSPTPAVPLKGTSLSS